MRSLAAIIAAGVTACAPRPAWHAVSPDHRSTVDVVQRGSSVCVARDARDVGCYDAVDLHRLEFSPEGAHLAYPVQHGRRWAIVRDGRLSAWWEAVGAPVWAGNGSRMAFAAFDGTSWRVVVDDEPGEAFDAVLDGSLVIDSRGKHVAYAARRGDSAHVVVDGVPGQGWPSVGLIVLGAGGDGVAYVARSTAGAMAVVNGRIGPLHDAIVSLILSDSGVRAAYAARDRGRWTVVEPEGERGPYEQVRALSFHPDQRRVAFVARAGSSESVVSNGLTQGWHSSVERAAFSAGGAHWGYVGHDSRGSRIVIDGAEVAREAWARDLVLSEHGRHRAWVARGADSLLAVVDDRGRYHYDVVVDGTLQFIGAGGSWACLAGDRRRRRLFVVVDGAATDRLLDWSELIRLGDRHAASAALRAWVGAEAALEVGMVAP